MGAIVFKYKPFWSLFINATENWLCNMAEAGLQVKDIYLEKSVFIFEKGEPLKLRYCFCYNKMPVKENTQNEKMIRKCGWEKIEETGRWSLYKTQNTDELNLLPNRRGLYLRNNSLLNLYSLISFIVILSLFAISLGFLLMMNNSVPYGARSIRSIIALAGAFAVLIVLNFLVFLKFTSMNNKLLEELGSSLNPEYAIYRHYIRNKTFEKWVERLLIQDGDIKKKVWPFWYLSPDKLESRLEHYEHSGLNFYKVDTLGMVFYFVKGESKRVKYYVLNKSNSNLEQTRQYLLDGWNIVYSTTGQIGKIIILSKQYEDEVPSLYRDPNDYLSNSTYILLKYGVILLCSFFILLCFFVFSAFYCVQLCVVAGFMMGFCLILFTKLILYYIRIKARQYNR